MVYVNDYSILCSRSFIVSSLRFRSSIHFLFLCGVRECSGFFLFFFFFFLQVAVQFSQHYLLKILSFLQYIFLPTCCGLVDHRVMGLFLAFYPVPCNCISVFVPVPYCFDLLFLLLSH